MLGHQSTLMFPGFHAPVPSADFSDVSSSEDSVNEWLCSQTLEKANQASV